MLFASPFASPFQQHFIARQARQDAGSLEGKARPKAAAKGKAAPPPPPPRKSIAKAELLPKWDGPCPAAGWKAERVVSWTPIRQVSRLEGSVWERVSRGRSQASMPQSLVDGLNSTFMCKASDEPKPRKAIGKRSAVVRLLPKQQALQADILHAKLIRSGIRHVDELAWVIGSTLSVRQVSMEESREEREEGSIKPRQVSTDRLEEMRIAEDGVAYTHQEFLDNFGETAGEAAWETAAQDNGSQDQSLVLRATPQATPVSAEVLEMLLHMLRLISDQELEGFVRKHTEAPSERFLQKILTGPCEPKLLKNMVQAAFYMARFEEASLLQTELERGLSCVRRILDSKAIPVLLEAVLLIGNYVNVSSPFLSGALGITLQSLAALATTKSKKEHGIQHVNAFQFVVGHLERTHPDFITSLARDLDDCRAAQSIDETNLISAVEGLIVQVKTVEMLTRESGFDFSMPEALAPERVQSFLSVAIPTMDHLSKLIRDLDSATKDLQKWFAESKDTRLNDMLSHLAQIREALPNRLVQSDCVIPEGKTDDATASTKRAERFQRQARSRCDGPKRKSKHLTVDFSAPGNSGDNVPVETNAEEKEIVFTIPQSEPNAETEEDSTRADSEVAPSVHEETDMFEDALLSLQQAVSFLQSSKAPANQEDPEAAFQAPLSDLESVLARLTMQDDAITNSETTSQCSEARTSYFFDYDDLPNDLDEAVAECDVFADPLADLQAIAARLQQTKSTPQRCWPAPSDYQMSEDAVRNFEAPLAELQLLYGKMTQKTQDAANSDPFEQPLAELQAVSNILLAKNTVSMPSKHE